ADEPDEDVDDRGVVAPARLAPELVQRGLDAARVLDGGRREQPGEVAGDGEDPGGQRDGCAGRFRAVRAVPAVVRVRDGLADAGRQIEAVEQVERDRERAGIRLGRRHGVLARAPAEREPAEALEHGGQRERAQRRVGHAELAADRGRDLPDEAAAARRGRVLVLEQADQQVRQAHERAGRGGRCWRFRNHFTGRLRPRLRRRRRVWRRLRRGRWREERVELVDRRGRRCAGRLGGDGRPLARLPVHEPLEVGANRRLGLAVRYDRGGLLLPRVRADALRAGRLAARPGRLDLGQALRVELLEDRLVAHAAVRPSGDDGLRSARGRVGFVRGLLRLRALLVCAWVLAVLRRRRRERLLQPLQQPRVAGAPDQELPVQGRGTLGQPLREVEIRERLRHHLAAQQRRLVDGNRVLGGGGGFGGLQALGGRNGLSGLQVSGGRDGLGGFQVGRGLGGLRAAGIRRGFGRRTLGGRLRLLGRRRVLRVLRARGLGLLRRDQRGRLIPRRRRAGLFPRRGRREVPPNGGGAGIVFRGRGPVHLRRLQGRLGVGGFGVADLDQHADFRNRLGRRRLARFAGFGRESRHDHLDFGIRR